MTIKLTKYFIVIMVFIIIPFFLDQLDGFITIILKSDFPVAKLYNTPTLFYAIIYVFLYDKSRKYSFMLLLYFFLFIGSTLVNINDLYSPVGDIVKDLGYLLKIFSLPVLFFYFTIFHEKNPLPPDLFIRKVFLFLYFAFAIAILFSFFGFGNPFYGTTEEGESIGQQGYFASGNEIGGLLILLSSFFFYYVFRSRKVVNMFGGFAISLIVGFLMGSKTAIATTMVCFLGVYFLLKFYNKKVLTINKLDASLIFTFTGMVLVTFLFFDQIIHVIQPVIGNLVYRYKQSNDITWFLTSGRLFRAEGLFNIYTNKYTFAHMLFGEGYTYTKAFKIANTHYPRSEMDFPDILVIAGMIGVVMIYVFWLSVWVKIFKSYWNRKHELAIPMLIAMTVLIINSNVSGHIIYSALVTHGLAYLAVFLIKRSNENNSGLENKRLRLADIR